MPNPTQFGIAAEDAFLMVAAEFDLKPGNLKVFARKRDKSKKAVKQGDDFSFEGEDRIEFEDEDDVLHFFFPRDFAFAEGDSGETRQAVRRFFYSDRKKHFLLVGVPYNWIQNAPAGKLIIDPTVSTDATQDVWLESAGNFNNHSAGLLVGNAGGGSSKKRTLIKFDLSAAGIPAGATIVKAQLKLKYYDRVQLSGVWVDRTIQAHQLLVDWNEAQANRDNRLTGTAWSSPYGGIVGTDAQSNPESSVLFTLNTVLGSWQNWDLTGLTRLWHDGSAPNFGVILLADNEDVVGYDLRFRSSDDGFVDQPVLEIIYTQPTKTVYFLKDHLGSIRATVDDIGQVVGYDDYDPWGFILAGRSMATGASTVQGAAKNKFTGKEWDDEFGLNWYDLGARPYDPQIGRFPTVDPLAQKYVWLSPYAYVANNPLSFIDRDGRAIFRPGHGYISGHEAKRIAIEQMVNFFNTQGAQIDFVFKANLWQDFKDFVVNLGGSYNNPPQNYPTLITFGEDIRIARTGRGTQIPFGVFEREFKVDTQFSFQDITGHSIKTIGKTDEGVDIISVKFLTQVGDNDKVVFTHTTTLDQFQDFLDKNEIGLKVEKYVQLRYTEIRDGVRTEVEDYNYRLVKKE